MAFGDISTSFQQTTIMHSTLAHGTLRPHFLIFPVQHSGVHRQRTHGRCLRASAAVDGMPSVSTVRGNSCKLDIFLIEGVCCSRWRCRKPCACDWRWHRPPGSSSRIDTGNLLPPSQVHPSLSSAPADRSFLHNCRLGCR